MLEINRLNLEALEGLSAQGLTSLRTKHWDHWAG